jgi:ribonuclease T2
VLLLRSLAVPLLAAILALGGGTSARAGFSDRPGDFDYYALVLSWSPSFCLSDGGSHGSDPQCASKRPYAFVVHGLWPQYDKGWPSDCGSGREPRVSDQIVNETIDAIPTEKLMNHEWQAHGTCSGLSMRDYFGMARKLYKSITIPAKYTNLSSPLDVTVPELRTDLLKANPQLKPNMIAVDCGRNGQLKEIHVCYSKDAQPAACGRNEIQGKMCRADTVTLPPVRGVGLNGGTAADATVGKSDHYKKTHKKHWYNGIFQRTPLDARPRN